ncbi:MAG: hypothetical protein Q8L45_01645 [Xanthomonadaceae bacterium]|nr:hypothetical protein [Xanthomonadaceae bacterium]MDP2185036.1 hypothetical protein [Xanthomonadales bacterium]MDZ4114415.1 hypothetical protein [Xanthomonadaceae bacterium]
MFSLVFGFGLVLIRQFEARAAARESSRSESEHIEREARTTEMRNLRGSIQMESSRIGNMSKQIDQLLNLDSRMRVMEEWRRHVPTNDDIDEVKSMVAGVSAQVAAIGERSSATQSTVARIENYLLEQK